MSGSVLGAPLKTVLVQASVGNAVVTVSHFDSDFLITGNADTSRMLADELEREATSVANQELHNLRDRASSRVSRVTFGAWQCQPLKTTGTSSEN